MTLPVDPSRYLAYLGVMAAMASFPGPANLYAVAVGLSRGPRAAMAAVLGMNLATLTWYVAAGAGLDAVFHAFPAVSRALQLAGAAYLAWLAFGALRKGFGKAAPEVEGARPIGRSVMAQAYLVQATNPKTLLFFSAILPPFLDLARPLTPQLVMYAPATFGLDVTMMSLYGLGGAAFARRMQETGFRRGFGLVTALLLAGAAVLLGSAALRG